ncbi:MAG: RNA polymerase sigma factor [Bacteroidales bacterium]
MTITEFNYNLTSLQDSLFRFANSLTTDKDKSKDLVQETYLKALQYYDTFVYGSDLRNWIFTIMKNIFINNYRRMVCRKTHLDASKRGYFLNFSTVSMADSPESVYLSKEIVKLIEKLDEDDKKPFIMHHEGFKYKEIAETLNLSLGTVKSRIFYTRKKLIKQLVG